MSATTAEMQAVPATVGQVPAAPQVKSKPDPRYLALRNFAISISALNIFGYTLLGFEQPWLWPILAVLTGYATELVLEMVSAWAQRRPARFTGKGARGVYEFLLPAHITALAANMLLYVNNQLVAMLFAVVVGVSGKHVLQAPIAGRMRHFMNPSNFGITVTLLCFGSWVSIAPPYQFTENADSFFRLAIPMIIITAGTVLNGLLTKRIPLIVGWLGGFVIQAVLRHFIWDVALASALSTMTGVAFVLFTNYMITDPGTTPMKPRAQFLFGASVAVVYGLLMVCNVTYTLFFATTIVCALRGLGWWVAHFRNRSDSLEKRTALGG
ncbi:enediyne biosynthesis protein [Streptomyces filamentosus]|uniref:enediyne biosynthesis protein n=1 Tax=Streptomyces filamentosus TaxID=67294 RepID=UPI0037D8DC02